MSAAPVRHRSIRSRVLGVLALVALLSVGTMAVVSYQLGSATLERQALGQLTAVRELQARQIETYFRMIVDQAVTSSENRMFVDALGEFTRAVSALGGELQARGVSGDEADLGLRLYYQDEFLPRLAANVDDVGPLADYWPTDAVARSLQHLFISSNPFDVGSKHLLDASDEGTRYDTVHERYHPLFRSFLERFGYYDIFLVDVTSHRIVYSVFKEVDFGTSLERGPYRSSNLAAAYRAATSSPTASFTRLEDFEPYDPSYGAPASFIASPVLDDDDVVGVLVFQLPLDRINGVMTSEGAWREVGFGETGESYIVGSDFRLRTESRFLVEDASGYMTAARSAGVPEATLRSIEAYGTAVGLQPVRTEGTQRALDGEGGVARFDDYRGEPVLSSFRPLDIPGLDWALMSEIDESEALGPLTVQRNRTLVALAVLLPLLGLLAAWFAGNLTRPLRALSATASRLAEGQLDATVDLGRGDEIGDLARSFEAMRVSLRELIERQNRSIEALSTPLIPIHDDVVVLPIVGELDQARCDRLRASLTEQLHMNGARFAILDLTGVPDLDEEVAEGLVRIARSVRLLGARAIISGVQPGLAIRMADGDVGIEGVMTARTLREAIETAVEQQG
jgi:anti-anti-sigma regulatory factor/HAMP domain-containing protein